MINVDMSVTCDYENCPHNCEKECAKSVLLLHDSECIKLAESERT